MCIYAHFCVFLVVYSTEKLKNLHKKQTCMVILKPRLRVLNLQVKYNSLSKLIVDQDKLNSILFFFNPKEDIYNKQKLFPKLYKIKPYTIIFTKFFEHKFAEICQKLRSMFYEDFTKFIKRFYVPFFVFLYNITLDLTKLFGLEECKLLKIKEFENEKNVKLSAITKLSFNVPFHSLVVKVNMLTAISLLVPNKYTNNKIINSLKEELEENYYYLILEKSPNIAMLLYNKLRVRKYIGYAGFCYLERPILLININNKNEVNIIIKNSITKLKLYYCRSCLKENKLHIMCGFGSVLLERFLYHSNKYKELSLIPELFSI